MISVIVTVLLLAQASGAPVQGSSQTGPSISLPRLIKVSGVFRPADGNPAPAVERVRLAIYADETGGQPLWEETQSVALDVEGRFLVLLGATTADGLPAALFGTADAQWLGMTWLRNGEVEGPRSRFISVPYALMASDSEMLGGRPASSYQLASSMNADRAISDSASTTGVAAPMAILPGTTNVLAKYVNGVDVGDSALYESGGRLGVNTTAPLDIIHSRFYNETGSLTGLVVQNLAATPTAYSGMLFRDQNGVLGQFQGFNNVTHEYRINNVARDAATGSFNGSINFMIGGSSMFALSPTNGAGIFAPVDIFAGSGSPALFVTNSGLTGVSVLNTNAEGAAVYGYSAAFDAVGLFGDTDEGIGVLGFAGDPVIAWAGLFDGDVNVLGTLFKGGGAFRIDHPLDPQNKYLSHSFVESPDMKNIYDGIAVFDSAGEAVVDLPEWFEALNRDFRYQLTPMGGAFIPYVAEEIGQNRFKIAGGVPDKKVSWQVTGIRHDAYANANRIQVEEWKAGSARGNYLHPQAFGISLPPPGRDVESATTAEGNRTQRIAELKSRLKVISQRPPR
jgi:hypothetical protein